VADLKLHRAVKALYVTLEAVWSGERAIFPAKN
jgi:hypothetical protein